MSQVKHRWNHTEMCEYCKSQSVELVDFKYQNGKSGCRHFRGGKSKADRGHPFQLLPLA